MTLFEALPPHDLLAEASLCAALMEDDTLINRVAPNLDAADFFRDEHAWVYEACRTLWERDEMINTVTVAHELDRRGRLEEAGGLTFLSDMTTNLPTIVGAEHYAAIVKKDSEYRKMLGVAMKIAELAYQAPADLKSSIARAESLVYSLQSETKVTDFIRLSDLLGIYLSDPGPEEATSAPGAVFTGIRGLDALIGGLKPGELIVIGADTSVGKTALMMNFALNAATAQAARVAIFSLEMGGPQLAQRLLSSYSRIDSKKLDPGPLKRLPEDEEQRVITAHGWLSELEIYIDDTGGLALPEMRRLCLQLQKERGLDLVVLDYLQLMKSGRNLHMREDVMEVTGQLKQMARQLDVPIVVGSQLSRGDLKNRIPHVPVLGDLKESSSIEQDADVVILIYREERYTSRAEWTQLHPDKATDPYPEGMARLIVAKQRQGPIDAVDVRFRSQYSRFEDYDEPAAKPVQMGAW